MSQSTSPFKFLDSYQQDDADVFFGREKETHDLYNALSGVKHLMVYGPSGAGKTSLVECGLRNQFSDADWYAITIRKGSDINASVFASINMALSEKIKTDPVTKMPADQQMEFGQAIEKLFGERYQPVYLLFDQFEELLISGDEEEKKKFFTLLNKLIRNKLPCRIMLIMREEFIGHLSEFEPLCPSIFQHRFRVEKMGRKNVEEVIAKILEAPRYRSYFMVADSLNLTENILSKLPDRKKEIELAHLQVFLGELWDRAQTTDKHNELPVLSANLVRDDDNLEGVLESFLKKQMKELEQDYGEKIPLELLAAMISERYTKLQLSATAIKDDLAHKKVLLKKPIAELLKELEQRRIVRTIKAGDETQYEISHDVLALVVGQNLTEEMKMREKARDIYNVYGERKGLFTQDDIDYLRPFQQSLDYPPELRTRIDESIAAIKKQREEELAKTRKRLRTVYSLLGGAMLALILAVYFGIAAYMARNDAYVAKNDADSLKEKAILAKNDADSQRVIAINAKNDADQKAEEAEKLRIDADIQKEAFYLISKAQNMEKTDPTIALEIAEEALKRKSDSLIIIIRNSISENNKFYTNIIKVNPGSLIFISRGGDEILTGSDNGKKCLWNLNGNLLKSFNQDDQLCDVYFSKNGNMILSASENGLFRIFKMDGGIFKSFSQQDYSTGTALFSPDGRKILFHTKEGSIKIVDLSGKLLANLKDTTKNRDSYINSVAFSLDGKLIITGNNYGYVSLWKENGEYVRDFEFNGDSKRITSIAFTNDNEFIMAGTYNGIISFWGIRDSINKPLYIIDDQNTKRISALVYKNNNVYAGYESGLIRNWYISVYRGASSLVAELKGHKEKISSLVILESKLYSSSLDGTIKVWKK